MSLYQYVKDRFVNMSPVFTTVSLFVGSAVVRVSIKDVNDNEPYFEQELYTASVREDSFTGQSIITIEAKDRDGQSKLHLTLGH